MNFDELFTNEGWNGSHQKVPVQINNVVLQPTVSNKYHRQCFFWQMLISGKYIGKDFEVELEGSTHVITVIYE